MNTYRDMKLKYNRKCINSTRHTSKIILKTGRPKLGAMRISSRSSRIFTGIIELTTAGWLMTIVSVVNIRIIITFDIINRQDWFLLYVTSQTENLIKYSIQATDKTVWYIEPENDPHDPIYFSASISLLQLLILGQISQHLWSND